MAKRVFEQMWFNDGQRETFEEFRREVVALGATPIFDKQQDGSTSILVHVPGQKSVMFAPGTFLTYCDGKFEVWSRVL